MIKAEYISTPEGFEELKKGDTVAVEWKRDSFKNNKRTRFASYEVAENKKDARELILQRKNNVYFNYGMFLNPEEVSNCKHIIKISVK